MQKAKYEYSFLIPRVRNSNKLRHNHEVYDWLEYRLCRNFQGYSKENGIEGVWYDSDGSEVDDVSDRYIVAVDYDKANVLVGILEASLNMFDQDCIYLRYPDGKIEFID